MKCDHKLDTNKPPRINCEGCWEAYFGSKGDLETLLGMWDKGGESAFRAVYGDKFVKAFKAYLHTKLQETEYEVHTDTPEGITSEKIKVESSLMGDGVDRSFLYESTAETTGTEEGVQGQQVGISNPSEPRH